MGAKVSLIHFIKHHLESWFSNYPYSPEKLGREQVIDGGCVFSAKRCFMLACLTMSSNHVLSGLDSESGSQRMKDPVLGILLSDPVDDYEKFCSSVSDGKISWSTVSAGDRSYRTKMSGWTPYQRGLYHQFTDLVRRYVDNHVGGSTKFNSNSRQWVWNWPTWHKTIIRLVNNSIDSDDRSADDCVFCHLSVDKCGRPKIRVEPGRYEWRSQSTGHKQRHNYLFYYTEGTRKFETTAGRVMCVLAQGPPALLQQASHRCYNKPPLCINPRHLIWEEDGSNKDRNNCANGCARLCPHVPVCIFTDKSGKYLPCRNDVSKETFICECGSRCWNLVTVIVESL
jgi:hypothetical protein